MLEELVEAVDAKSCPQGQPSDCSLSWGQSFLRIIEHFADVWKGMPDTICVAGLYLQIGTSASAVKGEG